VFTVSHIVLVTECGFYLTNCLLIGYDAVAWLSGIVVVNNLTLADIN